MAFTLWALREPGLRLIEVSVFGVGGVRMSHDIL